MEKVEIDVALVEKAKQGDKEALATLCQSSMKTVYFVALKILKNEADAEDIMADTMVTIVERLKDLSEPKAYISWVNRIAVNKCKNYLAKNKPVYLGDDETEVIENAELENYNKEFLPEDFVLSKEKKTVLMEIIKEKTTYAEMMSVIMFYYNDDSIKTIAAEMNCAEITVKTRLASARKKIKNGIEERFGKGVTLMAAVSLFVLSKALKAEAAETQIPAAAMAAATSATAGAITAGAATASGQAMATNSAAASTTNAAGNVASNVAGAATQGVAAGSQGSAVAGKVAVTVGKEVVKKSIKGKVLAGIIGAVAVAGITAGVILSGGGSDGDRDKKPSSGTNQVQGNDEEQNVEISKNYMLVETIEDTENQENTEYIFVGAGGTFTIKGYRRIDDFVNGTAYAIDMEGKDVIIDTKGKQIVAPGTYSSISRLNMDSDFYKVRLNDKYGIVNAEGELVLPCEFDSVGMSISVHSGDVYAMSGEKNGVESVYNSDGKLLISNTANADYFEYTVFTGETVKEGVIKVWIGEEIYYYSTKSGELLFVENDQYSLATGGMNPDTGVFTYYDNVNKKTITKLAKEDWSGFVDVEMPYIEESEMVGENIFVELKGSKSAVYDRQGNLIHNFDEQVIPAVTSDGTIRYLDAYREDRVCVIYNEKFEQVGSIENVGTPWSRDGYYIVLNSTTKTKNLYDIEGKLLYENVSDASGDIFMYKLEDGTYIYKKDGSDKIIEYNGTDKYYSGRGAWMIFNGEDGKTIIKDLDLKEIATFEAGATVHWKFDVIEFEGKYYNVKGKLLYELKETK